MTKSNEEESNEEESFSDILINLKKLKVVDKMTKENADIKKINKAVTTLKNDKTNIDDIASVIEKHYQDINNINIKNAVVKLLNKLKKEPKKKAQTPKATKIANNLQESPSPGD